MKDIKPQMTFIRTLIILFISKNYKLKYLFAMKAFKTSYTSYTQIVSKRFSNKSICHCVWQKKMYTRLL